MSIEYYKKQKVSFVKYKKREDVIFNILSFYISNDKVIVILLFFVLMFA